jgi:hypothetical protein
MTTTSAPETPSTTARRAPLAARRLGYVVGGLVNGALLYLVNVWPGWESLSFLTDETASVVGLVSISLMVGIVVNLVYLAADPPWLKALGDLVTTGVGFLVLLRLYQVFPFDFGVYEQLDTVARVVLVLLLAGTAIGVVADLVRLARTATGSSTVEPDH